MAIDYMKMFGFGGNPQMANQTMMGLLGVNPQRAMQRGLLAAAAPLLKAGAGGYSPQDAAIGPAIAQAGIGGLDAYEKSQQNDMLRGMARMQFGTKLADLQKTARTREYLNKVRTNNPRLQNVPDSVLIKALETSLTAQPKYVGDAVSGVVSIQPPDPFNLRTAMGAQTSPQAPNASGQTVVMEPRGKPGDEYKFVRENGQLVRKPTEVFTNKYEGETRKAAKPFIDAINKTAIKFDKLKGVLAQATGAGDVAGINAYIRMVDDGVVRGEDISIMREATSLREFLKQQVEKVRKGELLSPSVRQKMQESARQLLNSEVKNATNNLSEIKQRFDEKGIGQWSQIIPPSQAKRFDSFVEIGVKPTSANANTFSFPESDAEFAKTLRAIGDLQKTNPEAFNRLPKAYLDALQAEAARRRR